MQIATEAAIDIRDFYQQAGPNPDAGPRPDAARTGGREVLVLSIDATGVNMIPADLRDPAPPLPNGPAPPLGPAVAPGPHRPHPHGGGDRDLRRHARPAQRP